MLRQHPDNNQYSLSSPKTTIGSRDCELIIQGPEVAPQHLIIEKRSGADYVLHDLGTSDGTFVNQCRVTGASVKLNCGDVITLGPNSPSFTFLTPGLSPPTIVGVDLRPNSAPISKVDAQEIIPPRNHSALLVGRNTMRRNLLNGVSGSNHVSEHVSDHEVGGKQDLLEYLQRTVLAQDQKLSTLAESVHNFKSIEQQGSSQAQTINQLEREIKSLRSGENMAQFKNEQQRCETLTANTIVATLQTDVVEKTRKEEELSREVEALQREKSASSGTVVTLRRQLGEKEAELRQLKGEYNSFKIKPDELKEQNIIFAKENKNLRKHSRDSKKQCQEQLDRVTQLEKDLGEIQSKLAHETRMHVTARDMVSRLQSELADKANLERILKIETKESQVQLKQLESSVRESLSKVPNTRGKEEGSENLLESVADLVKKHLETSTSLARREDELKTSRKGYENIHGDLTKIELEALSLLEVVQVAEGEISVKVTKEADKIAALDISENLRWLQGMVLTLARGVEKYSSQLEKKAKVAAMAAKATGLPDDMEVEGVIENLKATTLRLTEEKLNLCEKVKNTVDDYEGRLAAQHKKLSANLNDEMASTKRLHEEQMRALYTHEQSKHDEQRADYTAQNNTLNRSVSELEAKVYELLKKETENLNKQKELETMVEDYAKADKTSRMMEESLRERVLKFDTETHKLQQTTVKQQETVDAAEKEAESLREQNRQYAVTIVAMENKIYVLSLKCNGIETELSTSLEKIEAMPAPPPEPYEVTKGREIQLKGELHRQTTLANTLRREFGLAKAEADQRAVQIQGLRCDLAGAAARLSDMSGELSESQKIEREDLQELVKHQERQIAIQCDSIDVLTSELYKVNEKLANIPEKLPKQKVPQKVKVEYKERELTPDEKDLVGKGKNCVEERHSIIIDKQRMALAEFREQLKTKSPGEIGEGNQQVLRLKKELNELRTAFKHKDSEYTTKENDLKTKARQMNTSTEKNSDAVKQLKTDLNGSQRLLGHNEACFASLATEMRSTLNQPQSPIPPLTIETLDQGLKDRALMTADLSAEIVAITTRLSQKDMLLSTYKDDLSQNRKQDAGSGDVPKLQKKVVSLQEEGSKLRKSMTHLQGELDQQQRLNNALAQRNAKREVASEPALHHHCPDPQEDSKIQMLKKQHQEEIKRKNYDIRKLKEVLNEA